MKFRATALVGVFEIELTPHYDSRGFFSRIYCPDEFAAAGIKFVSTQVNLSRNTAPFTLRGMHWQDPPASEAKIVRVTTGIAYDVVIDLRSDSSSYKRWIAVKLEAQKANALFIPEGCAHGFLTLAPETDVIYQMGRPFIAGRARGLRWDDPAFAINWPAQPAVISDSDLAWPPFPGP